MPAPNARTKAAARWWNAPTLDKLTASQQGGSRGAQLWGVQYNGALHTIYQVTAGGGWSSWMGKDWAGPGYPPQVYELAAAQQNNGCVQFWALDMKLQLWTTGQTSPGGNWSPWSGPNWNKARAGMKRIAASQQDVRFSSVRGHRRGWRRHSLGFGGMRTSIAAFYRPRGCGCSPRKRRDVPSV